jgi:hypothetical protein
MTYNKQLETIYNWYWGNVTKLYSAWEDFLDEKYYSQLKDNPNLKPPRREIFFFRMFIATVLNEDEINGNNDIENYTCYSTLMAFLQIEGQPYIKKCKNLKSEQRGDEIFPKLLRRYFQKREKIGWKKFEKQYLTKWNELGRPIYE